MEDNLFKESLAEGIGALIPGSGPSAKRAIAAFDAEWQRNTSKALKTAERVTGMTREDLAEAIASDAGRLMPLWLHVVWAAGMNGHDKTLRAMGIAFGDAVTGSKESAPEKLETAEEVLRAIKDFTPRHFEILAHLHGNSPDIDDPKDTDIGPTSTQVANHFAMNHGRASGLLANLLSAGLTVSRNPFAGTSVGYAITDLGRSVVDASTEAEKN